MVDFHIISIDIRKSTIIIGGHDFFFTKNRISDAVAAWHIPRPSPASDGRWLAVTRCIPLDPDKCP